jgi:hypothetical protein
MRWNELIESIGDVWVWWCVSAAATGWMLRRAASSFSAANLRRFVADDRGSSYVLPYVMTFPIYFLLVCIMIQATMIIMVKMGAQYAAYAAARSAIAWSSVEPYARNSNESFAQVQSMSKRAAATALTPFAPGDPKFLSRMFPLAAVDVATQVRAELYYDVYRRFDADNVARDNETASRFIRSPDQLAPRKYVKTKYRFAEAATSVTISPRNPSWNQDVKATVRYEMPMHLPGAGRILGSWWNASRFYSRSIVSSATLPSETADSGSHRIGIGYESGRLR